MVALKLSAIALVASAASALAYTPSTAASGLERREVLYRLRQRYAVENYSSTLDNVCLDNTNPPLDSDQAGVCVCGIGREYVPGSVTECQTIPAANNFDVNPTPQQTSVELFWKQINQGDSSIINEQYCGGVCASATYSSVCTAWVIETAGDNTNTCFLLSSTAASGFFPPGPAGSSDPVTVSSTSTRQKRAVTYQIGGTGGKVGAALDPPPTNAAACTAPNTLNTATLECTCAPGYINPPNTPGSCVLAPSAQARLRRTRRHFNGVQW